MSIPTTQDQLIFKLDIETLETLIGPLWFGLVCLHTAKNVLLGGESKQNKKTAKQNKTKKAKNGKTKQWMITNKIISQNMLKTNSFT